MLELVEAALDDVAAAVAVPLFVAEVDRAAAALAAVGDLIITLGNRRGDATLAQPCPVRPGRIALVGHHSVRTSAWPPVSDRHADLFQRRGQHACVSGLAGRQDDNIDGAIGVGAVVGIIAGAMAAGGGLYGAGQVAGERAYYAGLRNSYHQKIKWQARGGVIAAASSIGLAGAIAGGIVMGGFENKFYSMS